MSGERAWVKTAKADIEAALGAVEWSWKPADDFRMRCLSRATERGTANRILVQASGDLTTTMRGAAIAARHAEPGSVTED